MESSEEAEPANDLVAAEKADPRLKVLLSPDASEDALMEVVFTFRTPADQKFLSPDQTEKLTYELLSSAEKKTGAKPDRVNVFRNMQSFVVAGSKRLMRELLAHESVASAMSNAQPEVDLPRM